MGWGDGGWPLGLPDSVAEFLSLVFSGQKSLNKSLCYDLLALGFSQTENFGIGAQPVDLIYDQKSTPPPSFPG